MTAVTIATGSQRARAQPDTTLSSSASADVTNCNVAAESSASCYGEQCDSHPQQCWTCKVCAFDNSDMQSATCGVCGRLNPNLPAWTCLVCTFKNSDMALHTCGVCNSPRSPVDIDCAFPAANALPSTPAAAASQSETSGALLSRSLPTALPSDSAPSSLKATAPAPAALQQGSRVRIEGLQAAPEMNGRTGVLCGALNQENGRWPIQIDADGSRPACQGLFRPANLRVIPPHNFSTEWLDEEGRVWRKNVDFSRECAKGHALAPLSGCVSDGGGMKLMCRLCHSFCQRDSDEAASWLMCSVDAGCCKRYAVCSSCARAPSAATFVHASDEHDCTLVSCRVQK